MNICIGLISIILCVFVGFRLSRKFLDKRLFYQAFYKFNADFKEEVSFKQTLLFDLVKNFEGEEGVFYENIYQFYFNEKFSKKKIDFLSEEENEYFFNYLETLGRSDKQAQENFLLQSNSYISDKFNESISNEKKFKTLYIKIGFLIGLIIFIILL